MKTRFAMLTAMLLAGCQHYTAAPLAAGASLAPAVVALPASPGEGPLTVDQVVRLALENNPELRATRAKRSVADATLIQSGILPNPSLAGAILPLISGIGVVPAWNVGLSQDIRSLVTYQSRKRAGTDTAGQAAADLLWQEWQTAGQARQLSVDLIGVRRQRPVAAEAYRVVGMRQAAVQQALAHHDVTLLVAAPSLAALQTARSNLYAVDQRELQLSHQLAALLGLQPDAAIGLVPDVALPPFDPVAIRAGLATLPQRRPDLIALRLGYAAQDEAVRQAILGQFPDLVLGGSASSDSSKVINAGPNVTLGVPVFDRNQGNIAIARATRAQLQAEYAARLNTATGEVGAALAEMAQLTRQLAVARADLPAARTAADHAQAARGASAIDETAYVELISTRYAKEQDVMTLEFALLDKQVALQTLLGAGLPNVDTLAMTEAAR